ncbi:UNVERIFIED_CONTAM: hypothetical protein HDU68_004999 [Siphonaria sp. JEL0065]|nr:hypothetical protein HDU68_004999 [Siphonaria sp. JEL0065]
MENLYKQVMAKLVPQSLSIPGGDHRRGMDNALLEDDELQLDYAPDGGSSQRIGGGAAFGAHQRVRPDSLGFGSQALKSKKEEAEETVDKRLKELMELGQKKEAAAAAKPKKRKII